MEQPIRIALLGGDCRQISMARQLGAEGFSVTVWGLGSPGEAILPAVVAPTWQEAIRDAVAVVLPLPVTSDGVRLRCPLAGEGEPLRLDTLLGEMGDRLLLGGRMEEPLRAAADRLWIRWMDYYESEELQLKNALLTAEGAISVAMERLPVALHGCSAAVIGYGRIGSLLSDLLAALGASVTVYARREESLTLARLRRHRGIRLSMGEEDPFPATDPLSYRVLFNTVPHRLLTPAVLARLPKSCLLVDLASAPGGWDWKDASALGLSGVWATALPGKYASESAGIYLAETVSRLLRTVAASPKYLRLPDDILTERTD